jgi:hypothetical protein
LMSSSIVHDKNRFAGDLGLQEIFFLQDFFCA